MITTNVHNVAYATLQHQKFGSFRTLAIVLHLQGGETMEISAFSEARLPVTTLDDLTVESPQVSE
jgi:hypothetical protein